MTPIHVCQKNLFRKWNSACQINYRHFIRGHKENCIQRITGTLRLLWQRSAALRPYLLVMKAVTPLDVTAFVELGLLSVAQLFHFCVFCVFVMLASSQSILRSQAVWVQIPLGHRGHLLTPLVRVLPSGSGENGSFTRSGFEGEMRRCLWKTEALWASCVVAVVTGQRCVFTGYIFTQWRIDTTHLNYIHLHYFDFNWCFPFSQFTRWKSLGLSVDFLENSRALSVTGILGA